MPIRTDEALAVLGLAPGATADEIRQAYRDLAKVWHPDRFGDDARLRAKAEEQLKVINAAHAALAAGTCAGGPRVAARGRTSSRAPDAAAGRGPSTRHAGTAVRNRHVRMPLPGVEVRFGNRAARLFNLSVTGGQLQLEAAPGVGSQATLRLEAQRETLELDCRVIRVTPATTPGLAGREGWTVSVAFLDLSPQLQHAIPRFYNLLLSATRSRS